MPDGETIGHGSDVLIGSVGAAPDDMRIEFAAIEPALRALGRDLLRWREEGRTSGQWSGAQLKAQADDWAHAHIVSALTELTPTIPVWSEEDSTTHDRPRPGLYWLIDPIDGTASWAGGFSGFVTQVALMVDHRPELAVVFAPALDDLYAARRGEGATLNGGTLRVSRTQRCLLVDNYPEPRGVAAALHAALPCSGYLESGSLALKMCLVASGAADLFVKDVVVRDWDMAAPSLVATEAGATFRDLHGAPYRFEGSLTKENGIVTAVDAALAERVTGWYASWEGRR